MSSSDLIGIVLLGLGCAANPWGIMVAVLLLNAQRGLWVVWAYVVAWIGAISVVMAFLLAGFGSTSASSDSTGKIASIAELVIGLLLLAFGAWRLLKARRGSRGGPAATEAEQPGWLRAIEKISIIGAFLLGIYSATYPLVVAAAGEILRDDLSAGDQTLLAVIFVVLGSSTVVAVAALGTFAPARSAPLLARMRAWLTVNSGTVITAILLVFGLLLALRGIQSL
jgi:hypothetical protein